MWLDGLGATVVEEPRPGYGAAVHAGVLAASATYVAVVDGDDSMDLGELPTLLAAVRDRGVSMAVGRRRPIDRGVWPWHARVGTTLLAAWLRRSSGFEIHDLAPMRVCRRDDLLSLDVRDRRFGYPLELMIKAARGRMDRLGGRHRLPAAGGGYPVEGVRLAARNHPGRPRLPGGAAMTRPTVLVVAKAPVPGFAKTRIAGDVGDDAAAELAAAALLDTLQASVGSGMRVVVALTGDLDRADAVGRALRGTGRSRRRATGG